MIDYEWSSHKDYIRVESDLVSPGFILDYFGDDSKNVVQKYLQFMQNSQEEGTSKVKQVAQNQPNAPEIKSGNESSIVVSLEELLSVIAAKINIPVEMVFKKSKLPKIARARRTFIYMVVSNGLLTRSQASEFLGISQSTVTKAFNEIEYNEKNRVEIEDLLKELKEAKKVTK